MNKEENLRFLKKTESLVKPQDVTAISFLGDFNRLLPNRVQQKIMIKGSRKIPYMGFIVDPYCLFLCYRIEDAAAAQAMLPDGYEIAEVSVFEGEKPLPMVVAGAFTSRTSAFIGMRLEFYVIARNTGTGLISWIIADYETNTNSHDPKNGFCGYTCDPAVFTTTPCGELVVDIKGIRTGRTFSVLADLKSGTPRNLDRQLWIEGNLSVDYGGALRDDSSKPFSLIFDPSAMKEAIEIPVGKIEVGSCSYLEGIIQGEKPLRAAVFPYSQHFVIKQDIESGEITDEADLEHQIDAFLDSGSVKTMSGRDIKKPLYAGIAISAILNYGLMAFLLIRLLS